MSEVASEVVAGDGGDRARRGPEGDGGETADEHDEGVLEDDASGAGDDAGQQEFEIAAVVAGEADDEPRHGDAGEAGTRKGDERRAEHHPDETQREDDEEEAEGEQTAERGGEAGPDAVGRAGSLGIGRRVRTGVDVGADGVVGGRGVAGFVTDRSVVAPCHYRRISHATVSVFCLRWRFRG